MTNVINTLHDYSGSEKLTVGENVSLWMNETQTTLKSFSIKGLSSSIHTVEVKNIFTKLKEKNNYFELSTHFIPAPSFFDPTTMTFKDYIDICIGIVGLLDVATDVVDEVYKQLKSGIANENIPFTLRNSSYEQFTSDLSTKLDAVFQNTGKVNRQLSTMYTSFTYAEELFNRYNSQIKSLKARDPELLVVKINNLTELVKILRRKIEVNEIVIDESSLVTIELALKRVNDFSTHCGRLLTLCNELTRVLELQLKFFKQKI